MKLTAVLIVILSIQAFAIKGQNAKYSISMEDATFVQVIEQLEKMSGYHFVLKYNQNILDKKVNLDYSNATIQEILTDLLRGSGFTYKFIDKYIAITSVDETTDEEQQPGKAVAGKVTDTRGEPLPGVTVVVKGTSSGTITNADGSYTISNIPEGATLVFSFVGMKMQEIAVAGKTVIDITLVEDAIGIEEVVAIGYGTIKKANLTGAVSTASSERLENRPIVSTGMGLQGVIPNLNITILNGDPTSNADYNVRGYESINGGSPLILVDGVPMDLERINPEDIKSVNVLKDAAAAAVYGARAAFGVILVETKGGEKGERINVTLSSEFSLAKPIYGLDPVTDPYVYVNAFNKAYQRTYGQVLYDDLYITGTKRWVDNPTEENAWQVVNGELRFYGSNDYQNKIITDYSPQQNYDLTINGGTEKASYYLSFGYLNKDGYIKMPSANEKYKRYNILMKADFKINNWLSLDDKIVVNSQYSNKPHIYNADVGLNSVVRAVPIMPLQFPDLDFYVHEGDHDKYSKYIGMDFYGLNWLPYLRDGGRTSFATADIWLTQGITLSPVKGLKIRSDFSYNNYHRDYQDVASKVEVVAVNLQQSTMVNNGYSGTDYIENISNYNQYYVFNANSEYTLEKFKNHYMRIMVGFNQEWGRNASVRARAYSLLTANITDLNAALGTQETSGGKNHIALRGAFYRLNYSYKEKYLLEANGRYDGTSRFPKEDRFGCFPSVSLGWRISKESFMGVASNWLDNLKLRASFGTLGNQMVNDYYPYIATMGSGLAEFVMANGKIPYVSASGLVSPSLTWETVTSQNVGLDITAFKQRLDISADAYIRDTKDMLMTVEYPEILGTTAPKENAADLRTKGWDLSVAWHDKIGQDWKYGLKLAIWDNQSEITKYENPTGALSEFYVGQKIGEIWGYVTEGIFQTNEEVASAPDQSRLGSNWRAGDIRYADLNDDKMISAGSNTLSDPGDRTIIGNSSPRYSFGINTDIDYKNWSLNIFFQGLFRDYFPSTSAWAGFYPYNTNYIDKYYLTESWSEDNRDAYFPAPTYLAYDAKNKQIQSRFLQDAAYIRLKNLSLNYDIPQEWAKKIGLSRAQIYIAGMNLWEHTKMHKPLDPEAATTNQEYYLQRIYTIGVKVTF